MIQSVPGHSLKQDFEIPDKFCHFVNKFFLLAVYPSMKCYFSSMKKATLLILSACTLITTASSSYADAEAERILKGMRHGATLQNSKLTGHLRKDGKRTPLELTMSGKVISFQFYVQKKWTGFQMQLREGNAKLFNLIQGKAKPFPADKIGQAILNSDVTYEDLSLRFLYWKNAKIDGEEVIKTQKCHRIRLTNPGKDGRYHIVYVWVHQKYGALMQVAGYNQAGQLLKRFHVTELMTLNKVQTLKKMNIETYKPGTKKVTGITYLEFSKPKRGRL